MNLILKEGRWRGEKKPAMSREEGRIYRLAAFSKSTKNPTFTQWKGGGGGRGGGGGGGGESGQKKKEARVNDSLEKWEVASEREIGA